MQLIRLLKKDLAHETTVWVEQGIISRDQAHSICQHYGVDYDTLQTGQGAYRLLVALGYVFIGLAIVLLIGGNWEVIPREVRAAGLVATRWMRR